MNRTELIDLIADDAGLSKADAGRALDAVTTVIANELVWGGNIRLPGFGSFTVVERAAREGRNPQTGKKLKIAAKRRARFKEFAAFNEALNRPRLTGARRRA